MHLRLRRGVRHEVVSRLEDFISGSYTIISVEKSVVGTNLVHSIKLRADSWYGVPTVTVKVAGKLPPNFEFIRGVRFTILDQKYEQPARTMQPVRYIETVKL